MRSPLALLSRVSLALAVAGIALAVLGRGAVSEVAAPLASPSGGMTRTEAGATAPIQSARRTPIAFVMTMSDADLTKAAATSFPQTVNGVTVSDPSVRVESGGVRLTARAKVLFGTTEFVLRATPSASDGRLAVRVDSATLAGMSLPDSTRASITETLQATIARLVPGDARITTVTLAAGRLSVMGTQP